LGITWISVALLLLFKVTLMTQLVLVHCWRARAVFRRLAICVAIQCWRIVPYRRRSDSADLAFARHLVCSPAGMRQRHHRCHPGSCVGRREVLLDSLSFTQQSETFRKVRRGSIGRGVFLESSLGKGFSQAYRSPGGYRLPESILEHSPANPVLYVADAEGAPDTNIGRS
jgi:hypothetical protein